MNEKRHSRGADYHAHLSDGWDSRASVRKDPLRKYEAVSGARLFSAELVPVMKHPRVLALSDRERNAILAHRLFHHLWFTEKLERRAVLPACTRLAEGDAPFIVPPELSRDASRIITDEAHHATCASELTREIAASEGIALPKGRPPFLVKLAVAKAVASAMLRPYVRLVFVAVSETLITGTLSRVPADPEVHPIVRAVIRDHARDEAGHFLCFAEVIRIMWDQLADCERDEVGPMFAEFVETFLAPDMVAEATWLEASGLDRSSARVVVAESYESVDLSAVYREQAKPITRLLKAYGILDHSGTFDALSHKELL